MGRANYPQSASLGRSQRTGLSRSTVILAQTARKDKSQNDMSPIAGPPAGSSVGGKTGKRYPHADLQATRTWRC
jgi:hypothetical protein